MDKILRVFCLYGDLLPKIKFPDGGFGNLDYYDINYYNKNQAKKILEKLKAIDDGDLKPLVEWLQAEGHNGFYILGL